MGIYGLKVKKRDGEDYDLSATILLLTLAKLKPTSKNCYSKDKKQKDIRFLRNARQ